MISLSRRVKISLCVLCSAASEGLVYVLECKSSVNDLLCFGRHLVMLDVYRAKYQH